jgi:hypothetical protein
VKSNKVLYRFRGQLQNGQCPEKLNFTFDSEKIQHDQIEGIKPRSDQVAPQANHKQTTSPI